ncbi:MAG: 16S rRNA (guanine(527)-N(7))-methyltransferase RsmG [Lentisphaerae bacterium GWF2_52_8]|nr:MAG: 16S rRNA (guanine(527)-N(7))-methyltransferase RsmG [Lentisphaerae bacterium GWF2_52_8]
MADETANFDVESFCKECGVAAPAQFIELCERLRILLEEANQTVNLTRINSPAEYWDKHVADSLAAAKFFPEIAVKELSLLDIGCGAGFPSLILAAAFPKLRVTAMDSTAKKIAFVARAAKELGLKNLIPLQARAREAGYRPEQRGRYQVLTARAVGTSEKLFEEFCRLVAKQATIILYKTPDQVEKELHGAERASAFHKEGCFTWGSTDAFTLPGGSGTRCFLYARYKETR